MHIFTFSTTFETLNIIFLSLSRFSLLSTPISLWVWGGCWETLSSTALTLNPKSKTYFCHVYRTRIQRTARRKCACYSSKLFCQSTFYCSEKGEKKLNIFLVLRIKRLSVYPEKNRIVIGACVHCLSARGKEEWRDIWGEQLLWLRFFCCGWRVKLFE